MPLDHSLDMERLGPFSRFAELAAEGKKLMSITHSEITRTAITPAPTRAPTHSSSSRARSAPRRGRGRAGDLRPDRGGERGEAPVRALSEAHRGAPHVRGYPGTQKPDHVRHLTRMAETALPDLVRYWSEPPAQ